MMKYLLIAFLTFMSKPGISLSTKPGYEPNYDVRNMEIEEFREEIGSNLTNFQVIDYSKYNGKDIPEWDRMEAGGESMYNVRLKTGIPVVKNEFKKFLDFFGTCFQGVKKCNKSFFLC